MTMPLRSIKIIKREHRKPGEDAGLKTESEIKREILATITSWIEEQRETKKELRRQSSDFKRGTYLAVLLPDLTRPQSEPELL